MKYTNTNRFGCLLNAYDPKYDGMCYSCKKYEDYGPVAGRFGKNGRCKHDNHETDAIVSCTNGHYSRIDE